MRRLFKNVDLLGWPLVVLGVFAISACKKQTEQEARKADLAAQAAETKKLTAAQRGTWKGEELYQNQHFGFQLAVPSGWRVEKGSNQVFLENAAKMLDKEESQLPGELVFTITKDVPDDGHSVTAVLELRKLLPQQNISTGEDMLKLMQEEVAKISNIEFLGQAEKVNLGNCAFWRQELAGTKSAGGVVQRLHCRVKNGALATLGVSYDRAQESSKEEVLELLKGVKALESGGE